MRTRLVALGICLAAALAIMPLVADHYASDVAVRLLREATSREASVSGASLTLPSGPFVLRGVTIAGHPGDAPLLSAGRVEITVSPWRLPEPGLLTVDEVLAEDLRFSGPPQAVREFVLDVEAAARLLAGGDGDRPVRIRKLYLGRGTVDVPLANGDTSHLPLPPAVIDDPCGEAGVPASRLMVELLPLLRRGALLRDSATLPRAVPEPQKPAQGKAKAPSRAK